MKEILKSLVAALCLVILPGILVYSEGTKQIMPASDTKGQLCINRYRNDFAFYDAAPEFRLNISIADPSEVIRFGFGKILDENAVQSDLSYRIKGPLGYISPESSVPASGSGFISSYASAVAGPFPGGYPYLEFKPVVAGDYYIEFYYPDANADIRRNIEYFDITVVDASGSAVDGRVWSKAWHFWSAKDNYSSYEKFYGKMMILSDDSIVTQVDCNGFRGGRFSISSNMTGCYQTGVLSTDRLSRTGFHTYPQYKIFLNEPDIKLFPTQKLSSGIIAPVTISTDCKTGGAVFGIKVDRDCVIKLSIKLNASSVGNSDEVSIIEAVKANPGGNGYNLIPWNGNDNSGKQVANGTSLTYTVTNLSGITHLPMFDIENNDYGFIVKQIRPAGGQLKIYWDDYSVGGITNSAAGCNSTNGCHSWSNDFGDAKTINSWWFVSGSETTAIPFVVKRTSGVVLITGSNVHCVGPGRLEFSVTDEQNSTGYKWTYQGTGVTIDAKGLTAKLNFSASASADTLRVRGYNITCGDGPENSLKIIIAPLPTVNLATFPDFCYTAPGFGLTGGLPVAGKYFVDGAEADSLYPYKRPEGFYAITYLYTNAIGCSNTDTASIHLYNSPDCEGTIFFPDAFSPNSDLANDTFRPVVENIFNFTMYIYNKWGQLMYSTKEVAKGWDGKYKDAECPTGSYTYEAIYAPSLRIDEYKTKRGMFTLIR